VLEAVAVRVRVRVSVHNKPSVGMATEERQTCAADRWAAAEKRWVLDVAFPKDGQSYLVALLRRATS
jgi:hypothetical protein